MVMVGCCILQREVEALIRKNGSIGQVKTPSTPKSPVMEVNAL